MRIYFYIFTIDKAGAQACGNRMSGRFLGGKIIKYYNKNQKIALFIFTFTKISKNADRYQQRCKFKLYGRVPRSIAVH